MAESPPDIDGLAPEVKSFVVQLLEENAQLKAEMAALREELARLKGLKGRPQSAGTMASNSSPTHWAKDFWANQTRWGHGGGDGGGGGGGGGGSE